VPALAEVHYELCGPKEAPPLVLAGSLGTNMSMWDPQVEALQDRFRLLRYDLRGHGDSPAPPGPYSIENLGGDLLALLDRVGIEQTNVCGLSIGAMAAMWVAAHAPERVRRLILCCTSARFDDQTRALYRERAVIVRERGLEPIADAVLARWFTPSFVKAHAQPVERARRILVATTREGYAGCCEALAAMDLRTDLRAISAPALVIAGEDDPATPPEHGRLIAESIAGARLSVVSHAAHLANIERAELITAWIMRFVEQNETEDA
jgi:3-oxoadipate enol-lactonase